MSRYLRHTAGLASRLVGDEAVIVSPRAGKVCSLNMAGSLLWELADGSRDEAALADALRAAGRTGGGGGSGAEEELSTFASGMIERGIMEWADQPAGPGRRAQKAAERLRGKLTDQAAVIREEPLQVLAGACTSGHSGQGAACMMFGSA
jgi:hypothetical protein